MDILSSVYTWMLLMLSFIIIQCQNDPITPEQPEGTRNMIDSLRRIYKNTNFLQNPYEKAETITVLDSFLKAGRMTQPQEQMMFAMELIRGGEVNRGIALLETIMNQQPVLKVLNDRTKIFYEILAIAYLRKGEVENCVESCNEQSCLFPIAGKGIHSKKEGSNKALQLYQQIMTAYPDDLQTRYLLNIAYMTLGMYPDQVPAQWLIPAEALKSESDFPKFHNIAQDLGLDINGLAGGLVPDDFDNDGDIDLLISSWGMKDQLQYFENKGNGKFSEKTKEALLTGITGGLNMVQGDIDNDGFTDVLLIRSAWKRYKSWGIEPSSLLRNNGNGTFTDITIKSGVYRIAPALSATFMDVNLDGFLDIYFANETVQGSEVFPCELYINNGNLTFTERSAELNVNTIGFAKGVVAVDANHDRWPDIYVTMLDGYNKLFMNYSGLTPGKITFKEQARELGVAFPINAFPSLPFDINMDGFQDLIVSAYDSAAFLAQAREYTADILKLPVRTEFPKVYINNGGKGFLDRTKEYHMERSVHTMGCNFGDLDNDGYIDFYLGTGAPDLRSIVPNRMFLNYQGKYFKDITTAGGFGHVQKGHCVGFADFDNDGDQDIYEVMGGSYSGDMFHNVFYENPGSKNNWIVLDLEGVKSNRRAIGAHIKIIGEDAEHKEHIFYHTISNGSSFGANSLQCEAGIGQCIKIKSVTVLWPCDEMVTNTYQNLSINSKYKLKEGTDTPVQMKYTKFSL